MTCCFIKQPRITLVYIYPMDGHQGFAPKALEFAMSYERNPPGMEHDTLVVCNGRPASQPSKDLFKPLPNVGYIDHDNSGWDIGGFQLAARVCTADIVIFCGVHAYFRKPNWLVRMHEVFCEFGDTLYGSTGNQGDSRFNVYPHIRTTGFWCSPKLLREYPHPVTQGGGGGQRYESEHGVTSFTNWVIKQGKQPWVVGWDCMFPVQSCDSMPGGYHQGDQHNIIVGDRLTKIPYGSDA